MALSLSCPCGARFEVEEALAGQTVTCAECQQPVDVPAGRPRPVRTSGFALASTVLALVLAFTGVGSVVAVLLGVVGLANISQGRGRVTGTGYAVFGIVWGLICTGLFAFAVVQGEIFAVAEGFREQVGNNQVDRGGPLEVRRPDKGFVITRPTARWGIARPRFVEEAGGESDLMLMNVAKDAYINVQSTDYWGSLDEIRQDYATRRFQNDFTDLDGFKKGGTRTTFSNATIRHNRVLSTVDGVQRAELLADVKMNNLWLTFIIRIHKPAAGNRVYYAEAWVLRKRFPGLEAELRRGLDSFHLINE